MSEEGTIQFWSRERLERVCLCVLLGLILAAVTCYYTGRGPRIGVKAGDFPGTYSSAVLAAQGEYDRLYDFKALINIQHAHWPEMGDQFIGGVYPPYVAIVTIPLSWLSGKQAKCAWFIASLLLLIVCVRIAAAEQGFIKGHMLVSYVWIFTFWPVFAGLLIGQNVVFSLFCALAGAHFMGRNTKSGDILGGLCYGLWLFKPQLAGVELLALLCARRWLALACAAGVGIFYYAIAAVFMGPQWPLTWLGNVVYVLSLESFANTNLKLSVIGIGNTLAALSGDAETLRYLSHAGSWAVSLAVLWICCSSAAAARKAKAGTTVSRFIWYFIAPAAVALAPHVNYYDAAMCLLPALVVVNVGKDRILWTAVLLWAAAFALHHSLQNPYFEPLLIYSIGGFFYWWREARRLVAEV